MLSIFRLFLQKQKEEPMKLTPFSTRSKRRVQTTVDQSSRMTTQTVAQLLSQKEDLSKFYANIDPLRQKLFDSREETHNNHRNKGIDAEEVQRNYREKMIDYLDAKFSEAKKFNSDEHKKERSKKVEIGTPTGINHEHMAMLFKEYLAILREWNINFFSQYWVGVIMRELSFIRSMLEERDLISEIWKHLKNPTWVEVFVFLSSLYFHHNTTKNTIYRLSDAKKQLATKIVEVLNQEGHRYSQKYIEKVYDSVCSSSLKYSQKLQLLNNRQNRPTCCSWSRSTSRRRS